MESRQGGKSTVSRHRAKARLEKRVWCVGGPLPRAGKMVRQWTDRGGQTAG